MITESVLPTGAHLECRWAGMKDSILLRQRDSVELRAVWIPYCSVRGSVVHHGSDWPVPCVNNEILMCRQCHVERYSLRFVVFCCAAGATFTRGFIRAFRCLKRRHLWIYSSIFPVVPMTKAYESYTGRGDFLCMVWLLSTIFWTGRKWWRRKMSQSLGAVDAVR